MDSEVISLYNKKYYAGQHQKNFGIYQIEHVLQKIEKYAWEINSGVIKMHGTCQYKRVGFKKELNEVEMIEYVCSRKYIRSTKGTFHFGQITRILWNRSKQKVNGLSLNPWP